MQLEDILDGDDYYDYLMATGFADEVLAERRMNRQKEAEAGSFREDMERRKEAKIASQLSGNGEDNLSLEDKEKIAESGRMAVEAYKKLDKEKVREDTEKYLKQTPKEQEVLMDKLIKMFKVDMKKYGEGFSKEKIRVMLMDNNFQKAVIKVLGNEGGYVNDKDDMGGETKYGISKKAFPNENIKNLTKERAMMLYYTYYWRKFDFEGLSDKVVSIVFDNAVNQGVFRAKKNLLSALDLDNNMKISDIDWTVVKTQIRKLGDTKFMSLLTKEILRVYNDITKKKPSQKKYKKGWENRVNRY